MLNPFSRDLVITVGRPYVIQLLQVQYHLHTASTSLPLLSAEWMVKPKAMKLGNRGGSGFDPWDGHSKMVSSFERNLTL